MKPKHLLYLLSLLLGTLSTKGQTNFEHLPSISIGVGYFGEQLTHPGVVVFGEFALNKAQNQFLARLNVMGYRHRGHTASLMVLPELLFRRNTKNFHYWEASLGLGALSQWADRKVLAYEQGQFVERRSGWVYFAPSFGLRYGHSFRLGNGHLLTPNIGGRVFLQYPFNNFWLFRAALDLSISYQLK